MYRNYKYLLRPNSEQEPALDFLLWQSRRVYNAALEQRIRTYQETGKGINYPQQWAYFRDMRHENPDTMGRLNASSLQNLLRRLDKAFSAFYRRVKAGETPGFPRFKGRNRFKSIAYTYGDGCKLRRNENGRVSFYVQNVGDMRMCYHRAVPQEATIKQVAIKCVNKRWYACLMLDLPDPGPARPCKGKAVGMDVGLNHLLALSDGDIIENPHWLQASLVKMRVLQRRASRRQEGSRRRRKAYTQIAKLHVHIANQRMDYLHKVANRLVGKYALLGIEDLRLAFMNHNTHLALSSHDASIGKFRQLLRYKAEEAGTVIVAVNPSYTSQRCSECGEIVEKDLHVRLHECPFCGLILDRDVNAARNILRLALEQPPGRGGRDETWPVGASVS